VTFCCLLAVFPAVGAIVSLYGLVADSSTIRNTLDSLSSFLPAGALEIVGDQIQRVTAAGASTLSFSSFTGLSQYGANAGVKAVFDALNVAYGAKEERGFFKLDLTSLAFTAGAIVFALVALGPWWSFRSPSLSRARLGVGGLPPLRALAGDLAIGSARAGLSVPFWTDRFARPEVALDHMGECRGLRPVDRRISFVFLVCRKLWQLQNDIRIARRCDRLHDMDVDFGCRRHHGRGAQLGDREGRGRGTCSKTLQCRTR